MRAKLLKQGFGALLAFGLLTGAGAAPAEAVTVTAAAPALAKFHISAVEPGWQAGLPRDAEAATQAYLDRLPADVVARSNAYFEGGYWLQLWNLLLGLAVAGLMLRGRSSARLRDWAKGVGRKAFARDAIYGSVYMLVAWALSLPLTIYQGFVREHAYGMATQTFGPWFGEQLIGLGVSMLIGGLVVATLYAVIRRAGERWWLWGTLTSTALLAVMLLLGPILIEPLFNTYKPVEDGPIKAAVLKMAKANGVPADNIYEFDASRQTTRVSANVAGLFGSAAVRLNDNLLRRSSEAEIRAVMGHELGHYVLNHVVKMLIEITLLLLAGFLFTQWGMNKVLSRHGSDWGLGGVGDVAGLPLLLALFSVFMFVGTPLINSMSRSAEMEADYFGLNLAREPHGMSEVLLKLAEYRKPDPGPMEEIIFFDHPSARTRIHAAMRWREAMGTP
ncbi:M48 family metallopeptidase [Roseateles oligotrophus]|uniref:M48 family metallopeptidase n=1 Tax=Roseateles oligotrophus TaxID=1769250 RepID=A0ABT2YM59_9BURK|nr:M48 family metallopeptidase [Roseateles oligotrophus]MCV2371152.1 M48 family metallopeptidase [Roseateles oligotrophus]